MAHHFATSPEVKARLRKQRARASIYSILVALLVCVAVCVSLYYLLLAVMGEKSPEIVTYHVPKNVDKPDDRPTVKTHVKRKPTPPVAAQAKVIASTSQSTVAMVVPEVDVVGDTALSFGDVDDFSDSWNAAPPDTQALAAASSFFGQSARAERIAYVVDYSRSLDDVDDREELMRSELRKSLSSLPSGTKYQIIFFGGFPWLAGDKIREKKDGVEVTSGEQKTFWEERTPSVYRLKGPLPEATWITADADTISKAKSYVRRSDLQAGGNWRAAMDMAINMEPKPQIIYFITDGGGGGKPEKTAAKFAKKANPHDIVINTITMMQPKAYDLMKALAEMTNGSFTIVHKKNKIEHVVTQGE